MCLKEKSKLVNRTSYQKNDPLTHSHHKDLLHIHRQSSYLIGRDRVVKVNKEVMND